MSISINSRLARGEDSLDQLEATLDRLAAAEARELEAVTSLIACMGNFLQTPWVYVSPNINLDRRRPARTRRASRK